MCVFVDVSSYDAVETFGARLQSVLSTVQSGHCAVVADLRLFSADARSWAVLSGDRVVGMSAAVVPEIPLVHLLERAGDGAPAPETVVFDGCDAARLADEAVAVCRLTGVELGRDSVVITSTDRTFDHWEVTIRRGHFPTVTPAEGEWSGRRNATAQFAGWELSMEGTPVDDDALAELLWADVVRLARNGDRPWRAHRRLVAST
jgi:hypothetical protein